MLDNHSVTVTEERNSRKAPLDDTEAEALIAAVDSVIVAKGKKRIEMTSDEASVDNLKGPTGNYRAPMIRTGDTLLVGFNADALTELVS